MGEQMKLQAEQKDSKGPAHMGQKSTVKTLQILRDNIQKVKLSVGIVTILNETIWHQSGEETRIIYNLIYQLELVR